MMTTIEILRGVKPAQIETAVQLYDEAFGPKLAVAIPSRPDRLALQTHGFASEFGIAATVDGQLVGLAGFQTAAGSLTGGLGVGAIFRQLGIWRGLRAVAIFALYERKPKPGELVMDGIAVHQDFRGMGIGSQLLHEIVAYARQHGYKTVRLDVIDSNPRARQLYERHGFSPEHTESFPYLRWLLGFGGVTTMALRVDNVAKN